MPLFALETQWLQYASIAHGHKGECRLPKTVQWSFHGASGHRYKMTRTTPISKLLCFTKRNHMWSCSVLAPSRAIVPLLLQSSSLLPLLTARLPHAHAWYHRQIEMENVATTSSFPSSEALLGLPTCQGCNLWISAHLEVGVVRDLKKGTKHVVFMGVRGQIFGDSGDRKHTVDVNKWSDHLRNVRFCTTDVGADPTSPTLQPDSPFDRGTGPFSSRLPQPVRC